MEASSASRAPGLRGSHRDRTTIGGVIDTPVAQPSQQTESLPQAFYLSFLLGSGRCEDTYNLATISSYPSARPESPIYNGSGFRQWQQMNLFYRGRSLRLHRRCKKIAPYNGRFLRCVR
jgi:hypothetical protein